MFLRCIERLFECIQKDIYQPSGLIVRITFPPYHKVYGILTTFICLSGIAK